MTKARTDRPLCSSLSLSWFPVFFEICKEIKKEGNEVLWEWLQSYQIRNCTSLWCYTVCLISSPTSWREIIFDDVLVSFLVPHLLPNRNIRFPPTKHELFLFVWSFWAYIEFRCFAQLSSRGSPRGQLCSLFKVIVKLNFRSGRRTGVRVGKYDWILNKRVRNQNPMIGAWHNQSFWINQKSWNPLLLFTIRNTFFHRQI